MEKSRNYTYEQLIKAAEDGDASAKWMLRKLEIGDIVKALEKFATLDEDSIAELARAWIEIAQEQEAGQDKELRTRLLDLSDKINELLKRVSALANW